MTVLGKQFWELDSEFAGGWDGNRDPDGSKTLAIANNKWNWIHFGHVPTGKVVSFKGFVTDFSQTFEQVWEDTNSYGRMDPIKTFTRTGRTITLTWNVVAETRDDAFRNLDRCNALAALQYPVYSSDGIMQAAPLMRIRWANMIRNAGGNVGGQGGADGGGDTYGLVCTMNGFTYTPQMEMGFVDGDGTDGTDKSVMAPKYITMSTQLTVLHTHKLGWNEDKTPRMSTEHPTDSLVGAGHFPMQAGTAPLIDAAVLRRQRQEAWDRAMEDTMDYAEELGLFDTPSTEELEASFAEYQEAIADGRDPHASLIQPDLYQSLYGGYGGIAAGNTAGAHGQEVISHERYMDALGDLGLLPGGNS